MNDNIILYAISLICIILLLIEWIFISHKKCSINAIVFVGYSFPLYYLMIYKGAGGAAFTWWFYLVLFTSIHVIILLIIFFSTILRRRANERKQRCDKWNEGCAFFWIKITCSIISVWYGNHDVYQKNFLIAVANGINSGLSRREVLNEYHLESSANVQGVKKALIARDFILPSNQLILYLNHPILQQGLLPCACQLWTVRHIA